MEITTKIVDITTNEETITKRTLSAEEIAEYEAFQAAIAKAQAEAAAAAAARAELLARLGITADEAKLLLGGI
jgi:hypothetical protein